MHACESRVRSVTRYPRVLLRKFKTLILPEFENSLTEMTQPAEARIILPATARDWEQYFHLRYEVLRAPLNQPPGSEYFEDDATALHALALDPSDCAVGVGRIHLIQPATMQLRAMAVAPAARACGIGRQMVTHLEERARGTGAAVMVLEAREQAVGFYQHLGYRLGSPSHLLFGTIQHFSMSKSL